MYVSNGHKQPAVLSVLKSGNQFLLLKRAKEPNKGKYTPVGGKIEPYEDPGFSHYP
jgi:8-oxo-dGTP diphosphatase